MTINTLLLGDIVAGMLYGIIINVIIVAFGVIGLNYTVSAAGVIFIVVSLLIGAFCFSSLGALLASPASTNPSNVMMLSNIIRFPLIFISGIFVPTASLQGIAQVAVYCSPLTYLVDGFNISLLGAGTLPVVLDWATLLGFSVVFIVSARALHKRNLIKGL